MEKTQTTTMLPLENVIQDYSFYYTDTNDVDHYTCACGHQFKIELSDSEKNKLTDYHVHTGGEDEDGEYSQAFNMVKQSLIGKIKCSSCEKEINSIKNSAKLIKVGKHFLSGFKMITTDDYLELFFIEVSPRETEGHIDFKEIYKSIKLEKRSNTLYFKKPGIDAKEFDLDSIIYILNDFFKAELPVIVNIVDLHYFIGELAAHVSDSKNINIINGLLNNIRGRNNYAGLTEIKKVITIFLAIVKYSNLSTIAMTKSSVFLYDLLKECKVPKPTVLRENNITSPLKIFNFLITNHVKKLDEEINEDNKTVHDFVYKSQGKLLDLMQFKNTNHSEEEFKLKVSKLRGYTEGRVKQSIDGQYRVVNDDIKQFTDDTTISKYIFKNITNFSDYKQLIKYLKFFTKDELINLIKKYDLKFLTTVIDLIYFRDKVNMKETPKFFSIMISFASEKTRMENPTLNMLKAFDITSEETHVEEIKTDYGHLKTFDFPIYDDSIMMLEVLKFDRKKEFDKIKDFPTLLKFHDELVKFYTVAADDEKNGKFRSFVERFRYLESHKDYNGPLEIKLISTPSMLMREGVEMKHSASSYSRRVINEDYVIAQVFDNSEGLKKEELIRFTIGFNFNNLSGVSFDQVKGFGNKQGSDRFKNLLIEYLKEKDISYQILKDLKLNSYE